jgi:hypothetical protein
LDKRSCSSYSLPTKNVGQISTINVRPKNVRPKNVRPKNVRPKNVRPKNVRQNLILHKYSQYTITYIAIPGLYNIIVLVLGHFIILGV